MTENSVSPDSDHREIDVAALRSGLQLVRRRRWYFWTIILAYLPLMGVAMRYKTVAFAFISWFVVMFAIALYGALARCPRCGNYFHMHGMTLLFLRKCLHCQLHVTEDKRF
jgi:hypothetical protein